MFAKVVKMLHIYYDILVGENVVDGL